MNSPTAGCLLEFFKKQLSPLVSLRSALITLILKPDEVPTELGSYRPIDYS